MIIVYGGPSDSRTWGRHTFRRGSECDVQELRDVQEMLTQPGESFSVAGSDPLARVVGIAKAQELAVFHDVITLERYYATQHAGRSFVEVKGG